MVEKMQYKLEIREYQNTGDIVYTYLSDVQPYRVTQVTTARHSRFEVYYLTTDNKPYFVFITWDYDDQGRLALIHHHQDTLPS